MAFNRLTLLETVNRVLDAMNHDVVNSISDTTESRQIAEEARVTYYDLMDRDDWSHLMKWKTLEAVSDTARPNYLKIPQQTVRIDEVRYEITTSTDTNRSFDTIHYLDPAEFLDYTQARNSTDSDVLTVTDFGGPVMFILNDERPHYWTSFDDEYLVFDSYDSGVDTTLQSAKSSVLVKEIPAWTSSDTFVPDMPDQMFSLFLAEVTAASFTYWKQGTSVKDEQRSIRGMSRLRRSARKVDEQTNRVRHGRVRPGGLRFSADGTRGSILAAK